MSLGTLTSNDDSDSDDDKKPPGDSFRDLKNKINKLKIAVCNRSHRPIRRTNENELLQAHPNLIINWTRQSSHEPRESSQVCVYRVFRPNHDRGIVHDMNVHALSSHSSDQVIANW